MSIRQLKQIGWLSCGWVCLAWTACAWAQTPLGLEQVLESASANLEVSISRSTLEAARADITSADRNPFPVLSARTSSLDLQNGLGGGNVWRDKRIDKGLGLDITQERGNKRELRTRSAQSSARAAEQDLAQTRRQQMWLASMAYYDWLAQIERLGHVSALAQASRQQAQTALRRQQAGDVSVQDRLRFEIEARRSESDVPTVQASLRLAELSLRQVTRLEPPAQGWSPVQGWPEARADWLDASPWAGRLSLAVDQRPDVVAAQERVDAARQVLDLALAQKKSDITWGGSVDHYPGTSNRLLELRMQMPLQWSYQYQGEIARAQAQVTQSEDLLAQARLQARTELDGLYQSFVAARERWHAHRDDILPQARQVQEQAEVAYQKGGLSLTDLLDARRTFHNTWLEALAARQAHANAWAGLVLNTETELQARRLLTQIAEAAPIRNRIESTR
ncbi:MAG: hypothetical protein RIT26_1004 [Pseudomonadota bacterium]|jgi:cobalt-zinc-cadmium efflux system outer membrane protein